MGGHGGPSGFTKQSKLPASLDVQEAKMAVKDLMNSYMKGTTTTEDYGNLMNVLADHYKVSVATLVEIGNGNYDDPSYLKRSAGPDLPGQKGNPWPPNANKNHIQYSTEYGGSAEGIRQKFKETITSEDAKNMLRAVRRFTGSGSWSIRAAQRKGDTTSTAGKYGVQVEKFISAGIESGNGWNGGATYRGIGGLSESAWNYLRGLKPGDSVDCNLSSAASWSTNRSTSEHFGGNHRHVTFVHLGSTQKGVSVANISTVGSHEYEVLVSKSAKYKVRAVVPSSDEYGQTYIYVDDAD